MNPALLFAPAVGIAWTIRHFGSQAVRRWRPSTLPGRRIGELHVRSGGASEPVVVLLHGLVATGDIFGAAFDSLASNATLVVPDLLGFGQSLDETRSTFTIDDHLDALDEVLAELGIESQPIVVGAHSMGASLAVAWSARRGSQVQSVICWGPPVFRGGSDIDAALAQSSLMARLFAGSNRVARAACRISCSNRTVAGWLAASVTPELPVAIARKASLHTWPAYRDAISDVVGETDWTALAETLADNNTDVAMTWGIDDSIGDLDLARSLTGVSVREVQGAGHHLPLTHSSVCIDQLLASLRDLEPSTPES